MFNLSIINSYNLWAGIGWSVDPIMGNPVENAELLHAMNIHLGCHQQYEALYVNQEEDTARYYLDFPDEFHQRIYPDCLVIFHNRYVATFHNFVTRERIMMPSRDASLWLKEWEQAEPGRAVVEPQVDDHDQHMIAFGVLNPPKGIEASAMSDSKLDILQ